MVARAEVALENTGLNPAAPWQEWQDYLIRRVEQHGRLRGTWDPFRIYLACYRVLRANADPRAASILAVGHGLLQEQASHIPDEALRRSFLENVAENRELAAEFTDATRPE